MNRHKPNLISGSNVDKFEKPKKFLNYQSKEDKGPLIPKTQKTQSHP